MGSKRLLCVLLSSLAFAGCTAWQQGLTPGVIGASPTPDPLESLQTVGAAGRVGHLIPIGVRPKNCPGRFIYCVTVSPDQQAQLYFCYSRSSYCGDPSEYQYYWGTSFHARGGRRVNYFNASFNSDPGDPTYDTITEVGVAKSTHGRYDYEQWVCPYQNGICFPTFYVGIAVE